jgi:hypothetical protein
MRVFEALPDLNQFSNRLAHPGRIQFTAMVDKPFHPRGESLHGCLAPSRVDALFTSDVQDDLTSAVGCVPLEVVQYGGGVPTSVPCEQWPFIGLGFPFENVTALA